MIDPKAKCIVSAYRARTRWRSEISDWETGEVLHVLGADGSGYATKLGAIARAMFLSRSLGMEPKSIGAESDHWEQILWLSKVNHP